MPPSTLPALGIAALILAVTGTSPVDQQGVQAEVIPALRVSAPTRVVLPASGEPVPIDVDVDSNLARYDLQVNLTEGAGVRLALDAVPAPASPSLALAAPVALDSAPLDLGRRAGPTTASDRWVLSIGAICDAPGTRSALLRTEAVGTVNASASTELLITCPAPAAGPAASGPQAAATTSPAVAPRASGIRPRPLAIEKRGPRRAVVGAEVRYEIRVTNPGPAPQTGVVVRDPVPRGMSLRAVPPGGRLVAGAVTWRIARLPARGRRAFIVRMTVAGPDGRQRCNVARAQGGSRSVAAQACTRVLARRAATQPAVTG